jgi:hypothetical protein
MRRTIDVSVALVGIALGAWIIFDGFRLLGTVVGDRAVRTLPAVGEPWPTEVDGT